MFEDFERTAEFGLILGLAGAIREELGGGIEDQPGGRDPGEAGQVNRAYRAVTRHLLGTVAPPDTDLSALLSHVLARAASRRLAEGGLSDLDARSLLGREEGGGRDDWSAFLLLTPWEEVGHLLGEAGTGVE